MSYEILESLPDPAVRLDRDCRYLWVNAATAARAGVPAEALIGRAHGAGDEGAADARVTVREAVARVFATGEQETVRLRYRRTEGDRWYESHASPERDPDGRVRSVLFLGRDISRLKEIEHALGERVKELACLQNASRALEGIGDDRAGALRAVCQAMIRGWQFPELACARIVVEDDDVRTAGFQRTETFQRAAVWLDGREVGFVELCYREPQAFLPEEAELIETMARKVGASLHRARADRALAESREQFRALIEASSDLIGIIEPSGFMRFASPASASLLGAAPEDLVGIDVLERVHPEDRAEVEAEIARCLRDPERLGRVEYRIRHADGTYRTVETTGRNRVDDPSVRGIVTSTRDLSARRELESQLVHAQKMEAVGRLAGGIAHDFNNVLSIVESSAGFLAEELAEADPRRADVDAILEASRRASGLTRRLLAFSRKQVMQPRLLDLSGLVRDVEKLLRRLVGEDVELIVDLDEAGAWVRADPGQLEQVLLNLVVNARDAMPCGGRLTISVTSRTDASGVVGRVLDVRDTGIGMDDEVRQRIFDPFFTTKESGNGLGLATVAGIVQQSGGAIHVDSEVGRGTRFRIVLPGTDAGELRHPSTIAPPTGTDCAAE